MQRQKEKKARAINRFPIRSVTVATRQRHPSPPISGADLRSPFFLSPNRREKILAPPLASIIVSVVAATASNNCLVKAITTNSVPRCGQRHPSSYVPFLSCQSVRVADLLLMGGH